MTRVRALVEYDGTRYAGWQRQLNAVSVQQTIEEAISGLARQSVVITGASRTDAGVHARGQVFHFDAQTTIPSDRFWRAINVRLPQDIRVKHSCCASPTFHARYHAQGKRYAYHIHNSAVPSALGRFYAWHVSRPLNSDSMREALAGLPGTHDFTGLCAAGSAVKDKVRTVYDAHLEINGDNITIWVHGNAFLYNMVRIIAGTLVDIGRGKLPVDALSCAIASRNRLVAGVTAPPHGLCLEQVYYLGDPQP